MIDKFFNKYVFLGPVWYAIWERFKSVKVLVAPDFYNC